MRHPVQRTAIIDLGSNSARAVIMNHTPGRSYHLEDELREIVRLREGMTEEGLSPEAMERGLFTLRVFKRFCDSFKVDSLVATATSAVREAVNGRQFVKQIKRETGLQLRILDGAEEARYGVLGALNAVSLKNGVVVDIGGGSAQVSLVKGRRFMKGQALTLGALALTERFIHSDPIKKSEFKNVQAEIEWQLDEVLWLQKKPGPLVGLGGTIRTLAKIESARLDSPLNSINGFSLSSTALDEIIGQLRDMPLAQRRRMPGMVRDRADILLPGAMVIRAVMTRLDVDELTVSEYGLREGLFFEKFWKKLPYPVVPNLREFSVLNMARFYGYQETHAQHVCHLACRMFDQLKPLHGYGVWERELLWSAALLHDIGTVVRYNDHHKYSEILIAGNGLPGYSPREISLIALLCRYHRKGTPAQNEYSALLQDGDELRLMRLAALLRAAEYLERGRNGAVRDVHVRRGRKNLRLALVADEFPAVEIWDTERHALALLETAYGQKIAVESTD